MKNSITKKTDSSVASGLKIAANTKSVKTGSTKKAKPSLMNNEEDADELVHQSGVKSPKKTEQEDMDDLVHQKRRTLNVNPAEEQDIDDLLHSKNDYKPDQ